jgi:hypothetical protein
MKRQVDIYIEGTTQNDYTKLDLFDDEKINISSSIQNIQDISKVYTDFSQSFTVPASDNNNKIFEYFYQNDVNNKIDHNQRRFAYIEIGLVPFRTGKIQLEGSSVKDGKVQHYSITFYGDLTSLKDKFGIAKISDLNYSFLTDVTSGAEIQDRVTNSVTDYDVRFPLITSEKAWSYNDATSTDINTSVGRIDYAELFPAVKVSKIFQAIQTKYDITFQSTFLQTNKFKKLFLWCKNIDNIEAKKYGKYLTYTDIAPINDDANVDPLVYDSGEFTLRGTTNGFPMKSTIFFRLDATTVANVNLGISVYKNGLFYQVVTLDSAIENNIKIYEMESSSTYEDVMTFKVRSDINTDIRYSIIVDRVSNYTVTFAGTTTAYSVSGGGVIARQIVPSLNVPAAYVGISDNMPDITISDFFSGILKQFNLTCYSVGVDTFQIEPLDNWYSKGATTDITKYVDTDTISIDRLPLYKKVSFNYQKSESFTNRAFGDANGREYGDISNDYPYDGGEFNISVPFENLQFQKFSNTNIQVGYALTSYPDLKPYVPKPILLYYNGHAPFFTVRFFDGTTETSITNTAIFGQDLEYNNQIYSLNFSSDNSTWYDKIIDNSLFATYYFGYLSNLFNTKNRLTKIKAYFPIGLVTSLRLNDRLVIQDKRYIINSFNSDITTGEVSLELINDFRKVIQ